MKRLTVIFLFAIASLLAASEETILSDRTEQAQEEEVRIAVTPIKVWQWAMNQGYNVIPEPNFMDKDRKIVEWDMNGDGDFPPELADTVRYYLFLTDEDFRKIKKGAYRKGRDGSEIVQITREAKDE